MERREHTFFDKYQKIKYENVTEEELDCLKKYYNKDKYLTYDQYIRQNTILFSCFESDDISFDDLLIDSQTDIEQQVTSEIFFKELFSGLSVREKIVVYEYFVFGKKIGKIAKNLNMSYRQVSRYKASALKKMNEKMVKAGYTTWKEAENSLIRKNAHIPTKMEAQESIIRKRKGKVRFPSDQDHKRK